LFQNSVKFFDLKNKEVVHEFNYENEEINNFEFYKEKNIYYLFTYT